MPATPVHDTAVIDEPWDGGAQQKKLKTPITGAAGKAMYAWYDPKAPDGNKDGFPDAQFGWKLPHHEVSGAGTPGAANIPGVRNALARLGQPDTNIPDGDKDATRKHLQHHLDAFNKKPSSKAPVDDGVDEPDQEDEDEDDEDTVHPVDSTAELLGLRDLPRVGVSATAAIAEEYLPLVRALQAPQPVAGGGKQPEARGRGRGSSTQRVAAGGAIAVLSLQGVITPRGSLLSRLFGFGSGGLEGFRDSFREALADDEVSAIIIDIDSPGGLIDLVPETAAEVRAARGNGKQIVAIANTMAGSAAYWIAAQADEMVVTPSGQVGSIGVYTIHEDVSKLEERIGIKTTVISAGRFKAEGSPWEPLSRGAQQALQSNVDDLYALFVQDVAAGRGVKTAAVTAGYGEGRMVLAAQALPLKMVDRVETIEQTIIRLGGTADDDQPDDDDDDATQPDDPDGDGDDDSEDAPEARAQSAEGAERLYGEDRREQPAWLL